MNRLTSFMITGLILTIFLVSLADPARAESAPTLRFDQIQITEDHQSKSYLYDGAEPIELAGGLTLSAFSYLIEKTGEGNGGQLQFSAISETKLYEPIELLADQPTSSENRYQNLGELLPRSEQPGLAPVYIGDEIMIGQVRYLKASIFPLYLNEDNNLTLVDELDLILEAKILGEADLLRANKIIKSGSPLSPPLSGDEVEYVIITGGPLEAGLQSLADYKNALGIKTELVNIDDILAHYSGRDEAEQLREFCKEFYADGGRFILLGGDETIVPIRYAYHYRTTGAVDLSNLQVSDLYFADVDGDWNADNDQIWGERYDDEADLTPELMVGRLPLHDSIEAVNYVAKLIAYETDPGDGDYAWLTRSYFYSSDQMRDYQGLGQHNQIGAAFPDWFELDTISGVEASTGDDLGPTNDMPLQTTQRLSEGFGIVNIIAHGRGDGFIVKSSGYNNWPKAYILTAEQNGGHGSFDSLAQNGKAGFYYSLACDNGGFDLEAANNYSSPALSRSLLGMAESGAVAFVAYSRWGWVGSSHLLQKAFFDSLFAHPGREAIVAFNEVKQQFYYMRDLVLGQNFLGDPTLKIHTEMPTPTQLSLVKPDDEFIALVTSKGYPVANASVKLSQSGIIVGEYLTGPNGQADLPNLTDPSKEYTITATKAGQLNGLAYYAPSIATDIDEPESALPEVFSLGQNYPNPFNPETTIPLTLPYPAQVTLTIINILGQSVTVLQNQQLPAGEYSFSWNGRDESGATVASGTYFYRLATGSQSEVRKMVLVR